MGLVAKSLCGIANSDVNAGGVISAKQIGSAKEILSSFDGDSPKVCYSLIKGQPQVGKTGVLYGFTNIINMRKLKDTLGAKRIMYITADNSKDLVRQQIQRMKSNLMHFSEDDLEIMFMKRSDFKHYKEREKSIDDTIIFIDESHYGTSRTENKLPAFLKHYGIDYLKNTNLEEHNIRIISCTATPYSELESDTERNKLTVYLEPSEGYVGISDFENVIPLKKNVFDKKVVKEALPNFINEAYDYLSYIENEKKKVKCAIVRACGKSDLTNLIKYGSDKFDIYQFDTSRGSALDYQRLWDKIDTYCGLSKGRTNNKYLMVVVKNALRMGISVREREDNNDTKNRIAVLYDYASEKDKPEDTEQGLLGRMCGYRDQNDTEWKDIKFYLNESHYITLKNAYEKGFVGEDGRLKPLALAEKQRVKEEIFNIEGMISDFEAETKKLDIEALEKEGKIYHIDVGEEKPLCYDYNATDFYLSKVGTSFGGFDNFQLNDMKTSKHIVNFIKPFLESVDGHYKSDKYVYKGSRRCGKGISESQESFVNALKDERRMLLSSACYPINPNENGKYAWQVLLNMDEMENPISPRIYVRVKISQLRPFKYNDVIVENGTVPKAETMITGCQQP